LSENLIKQCTQLRGLDVSNMFVARNNDVVPEALKTMLDAAIGHSKIRELRLSHNAVGDQAIHSLDSFLEQAEELELIDISNCGLSPEATQDLAKALDSCHKMRLKEFIAIRQQIRDTGIMALAKTFGRQGSIKVLNFNGCHAKVGLKKLFSELSEHCAETLEELHLQDNRSINPAVNELNELI